MVHITAQNSSDNLLPFPPFTTAQMLSTRAEGRLTESSAHIHIDQCSSLLLTITHYSQADD